jgi:hypothetical protein
MADYDSTEPLTYLNQHLSDFVEVAFFDAQEAQNEFARLFDTLKQRFIEFSKIIC